MSNKTCFRKDCDVGEWTEYKTRSRRKSKNATYKSTRKNCNSTSCRCHHELSSCHIKNGVCKLEKDYDDHDEAAVTVAASREKKVCVLRQNIASRCDNGNERYKTEFCKRYREHGRCKYGEKCLFAHGLHELRARSRPHKYKTEKCQRWWSINANNVPARHCEYGERCRFIHDETPETLTENGNVKDDESETKLSRYVCEEKGDRSSSGFFEINTDKISCTEEGSKRVELDEDALLDDVWSVVLSSQTHVSAQEDIYDSAIWENQNVTIDECGDIVTEQELKTHLRRLNIFDALTDITPDCSSYCVKSCP